MFFLLNGDENKTSDKKPSLYTGEEPVKVCGVCPRRQKIIGTALKGKAKTLKLHV